MIHKYITYNCKSVNHSEHFVVSQTKVNTQTLINITTYLVTS